MVVIEGASRGRPAQCDQLLVGHVDYGNNSFTYLPCSAWEKMKLLPGTTRSLSRERALHGGRGFKRENWGEANHSPQRPQRAKRAALRQNQYGLNGETATGAAGYGGTSLMNLTVAMKCERMLDSSAPRL